MVIICIRRKVLVQRSFAEHDHLIQALAADRADQPFDVRPLPRRSWRRQHLLDPLRFHLVYELLAEDLVAVAEQVARCSVPGERFPQLLRCPLGSRMLCHPEVDNAPTVVCQNQEHVEDLKPDLSVVKTL